jgi:hypothetical protein
MTDELSCAFDLCVLYFVVIGELSLRAKYKGPCTNQKLLLLAWPFDLSLNFDIRIINSKRS